MRATKPREIPDRIRELVKQGCPPMLASRKALREVAAARARSAEPNTAPPPSTRLREDESADTAGRRGARPPAKRVTTVELQRLADRLGTMLDVQRGRAVKAGYTVAESTAPLPPPAFGARGGQSTRQSAVGSPEPRTLSTADGLTAEFNRLKEGAHGGAVAGVVGVFQARTLDEHGQPKSGLTLDEMLDRLRQNPNFQWLETTDDLIAAIAYANRHSRPIVFPDTMELKEYLGIDPATKWWEDSWLAPQEQPTISETSAADAADTDTFFGPSAAQPRESPPTSTTRSTPSSTLPKP